MRASYVLIIATLVAPGLAAQESDRTIRRLSVSGTVGVTLLGPKRGHANQLRSLGFDDTRPYGCFIFCGGPTEYPQAEHGPSASLRVRYEIDDRWGVSVGIANTDLGGARGYRDAGALGQYLEGHYWRARAIWAAAHFKPGYGVSLGGGISTHALASGFEGDPGRLFITRIGLTAEAGLRLPRRSRVFWEVTARGHVVPGSIDEVHDPIWGEPVTLHTSWPHMTLETGVGVRLW